MFFKRREKRGRDVWIIAGLGNIGPEYDGTRHNCGFMAVDLLAAQYGIAVTKKKAKGTLGEGKIAGHDVVLVKPDTYMNLSGVCIRGVLDWYKQALSSCGRQVGRTAANPPAGSGMSWMLSG